MPKPIEIVVCGAAGRMGATIVRRIMEQKDLRLTGAIETPSSPSLDTDAGVNAGAGSAGVRITMELGPVLRPGMIVISFADPAGSLAHARQAAAQRCPIVIGTTGLSSGQMAELKKLSSRTPVVWASNMSTGVNLLWKLAETAAALLRDYDVEIVETHHNRKQDAPSGTALSAAQAIARAQSKDLARSACYGRKGKTSPRRPGEIGIHAVRAGDVVGEHTVIFAGPGERLELTHRAHSRDNFALGSLRAARFLSRARPGFYTMAQVLGLR